MNSGRERECRHTETKGIPAGLVTPQGWLEPCTDAAEATRQSAACTRLQELCRAQHAAARAAEATAAANAAAEAAARAESAAAQRAETARVEALVASVQRECAPWWCMLPCYQNRQ